jgi:hypothetical protein
MKKFTIKVEGKEYILDLEDEFALYMQTELKKSLSPHTNNSAKELLSAYLKKCYECYLAQKEADRMLKKFETCSKL